MFRCMHENSTRDPPPPPERACNPLCTSNVRHYGLWHELTSQMTADTATWIVLSRQSPLSLNMY